MASKEHETNAQKYGRLQNEKSQLKKEEVKLRALIKTLSEQMQGVEVERLAVKHELENQEEKEKASPDTVFKVPANPPPIEEVNQTKLDLNVQSGTSVLDLMSRGVFVADHEEEEDSD